MKGLFNKQEFYRFIKFMTKIIFFIVIIIFITSFIFNFFNGSLVADFGDYHFQGWEAVLIGIIVAPILGVFLGLIFGITYYIPYVVIKNIIRKS
jgi:hypothetical protein